MDSGKRRSRTALICSPTAHPFSAARIGVPAHFEAPYDETPNLEESTLACVWLAFPPYPLQQLFGLPGISYAILESF